MIAKDYTQVHPHGTDQTAHVDNWQVWTHEEPKTREQVQELAMRKYLADAGLTKGKFAAPHKFTVYHYREGDPTHPNGRPMCVHAVTMIANP